ncbi:MAG: IS21 family transposase [Armatimonadota bacterium]
MRKIREVLRLRFDFKQSYEKIANSCVISSSTAAEIVFRFKRSGLPWPLPEEMNDDGLEKKLYPPKPKAVNRPVPDWAEIHRELKGKYVTLMLLWQEYSNNNPLCFGYSWFCHAYEKWRKKTDITMRQHHRFGEKCFVDYAGGTVPIVNGSTGEIQKAQIFVGVLGASNYTYAEAAMSQDISSWIGSHIRMFNYFGGVSEIIVPDNLKSGVKKACYYEPDINPTYLKLAEHYGFAVLPARAGTPKDKAKAENGVLIVGRWILAVLRKRKFYSLTDLNKAVRELLDNVNNRKFQKLPYSRKQLFEEKEKSALKELPSACFEFGTWKTAKVFIDYHVEVEGHYYSVPYKYVKEKVDIRITSLIIEIFHKGIRVAGHKRSFVKGGSTTLAEHMPSHHREKAEWTPERIKRWGSSIGEFAEKMADRIMSQRQHPELGFKSCFGLFRLAKTYGSLRFESACRRAWILRAYSYKSVKSILKTGLDKQALPANLLSLPRKSSGYHENVRGADYYSKTETEAAL